MKDKDVVDMMLRCAEEIESLRRINVMLQPKAEAYDAIVAILGLLPKQSQGYGEDLAWRLRKEASALTANVVEKEQ